MYSSGTLSGSLVVTLPAGKHTVKLQWRKWGSTVRLWRVQPSLLDGFVCGRMLAVLAEHFPIYASQPLQIASREFNRAYGGGSTAGDGGYASVTPAAGGWSQVSSSQLSFTLSGASTILFTYVMTLSTQGDPRVSAQLAKQGTCPACCPPPFLLPVLNGELLTPLFTLVVIFTGREHRCWW